MTYASVVLADAPKIYYKLSETAGTVAVNDGSLANDGTFVGAVTLNQPSTPGTVGDGVAVKVGSGSYINSGYTAADLGISGSHDFTIEFWWQRDPAYTSGFGAVFSIGSGSGGAALYMGYLGAVSGRPVNRYEIGIWGGLVEFNIPNDALKLHHIAIRYSAAGSLVSVWIDGAAATLVAGTGSTTLNLGSASTFQLGRLGVSGDSPVTGWLDEVAVYDTRLSDARIIAHNDAGQPPPVTGPVGRVVLNTSHPLASALQYGWVFSEGSGQNRELVTGTLNAPASWSTAGHGRAARIGTGVDPSVTVINTGLNGVPASTDISIVAGFSALRPHADPVNSEKFHVIIAQRNGGLWTNSVNYEFGYHQADSRWYAETDAATAWISDAPLVSDAAYHHVQADMQSGSGGTFYRDGAALGAFSAANQAKQIAGLPIYLGGRGDGKEGAEFDLHYVFVFTRKLTTTEAAALALDPYAFVQVETATAGLVQSGASDADGFGASTLSPGAVSLTASGFNDGDPFGTSALSAGAVALTQSGSSDPDSFGVSTLALGGLTLVASGFSDADGFGASTVSPGAVVLFQSGAADADVFGASILGQGGAVLIQSGTSDPDLFGAGVLTLGAPAPLFLSQSGFTDADGFGVVYTSTGVIDRPRGRLTRIARSTRTARITP